MNRHAVAGEITASIAHELKQPLTAILSNAEAAHDLLGGKDHDPEAIREIVADIIDEDTRAADVLDRIRALPKATRSRTLGRVFSRVSVAILARNMPGGDIVRPPVAPLRYRPTGGEKLSSSCSRFNACAALRVW